MEMPSPSVHERGQRRGFLLWNLRQAALFGRIECTGFRCISGKEKHGFDIVKMEMDLSSTL